MKCVKCQSEVPEGALFCSGCGSKMPQSLSDASVGNLPTQGREAPSFGDEPILRGVGRQRQVKAGDVILMKCPKCQVEVPEGAPFCSGCGSEMPQSRSDLSVGNLPTLRGVVRQRRFKAGDVILKRYRVLSELGQGGMGVVYRCLDQVGRIEVALKALPPELSHNSGEMEEVRENFQIVEKLHHPDIATVKTLEFDEESETYYLILEMVEGVDLRKWRKQQGGKVALDKALPVLRQIAQALDFAHSKRVIHRDIKPGNVLVTSDGTVKVLDFGLAAQIQSSLSRVSQVHFSTSGTGPYMAPEQWKGKEQNGATDQYALAATAYELVKGRPPFESQDQVALRESVLQEPPDKPEELLAPQWSALARALSKEPSERFADCMAFVEALEGKSIPVVPATRQSAANIAPQVSGARQSRRYGMGIAIAVGLLLLCVAGWYFGKVLPEESRRKAELARVEEQARAEKDAVEKTRLEAEAQHLRNEQEKQAAADKAKAAAEARERERLASAKGGLILKTEPMGAQVTLGGEDAQTSPATFKGIKIGKYPLRVSLEGYEPESQEVEIKENDFSDLGTMKLVRSVGSALLSSEPSGADYEIKGKEIAGKEGRTPALIKGLPTGEYEVGMKRGDWRQSILVKVTRNETAEGKVEFAYGSVSIKSKPPGAKVVAGGKELGQTPLELKDLRPGTVSYTLTLAKYKDAAVSGTVEGKKALELSSKLEYQPYPVAGERWTNSLGQAFAPVSGLEALFCIWDVRVKDFEVFANATGHDASAGMWSLRAGTWGQHGDTWKSPGFSQGPTHPVCGVSWEDGKAYCKWLTEKERKEGLISESQSYRLPTDSEWSVAVGLEEASGGSPKDKGAKIAGVYPWGTAWPPPEGAGNYAGSEAKDGNWPSAWGTIDGYRDGYARTSPVGSFRVNKYGLYDMGGNVWQWCEDWYDNEQKYRVLRGGSWYGGNPDYLLSSNRIIDTPGYRGCDYGFRVVLVVGGSAAR